MKKIGILTFLLLFLTCGCGKVDIDKAKNEFENNVLNELIKLTEAEIPECMIEDKQEQLANDFNYRLQQQGLDPKLYLQYTGMTEETFKGQFKEKAEEQVKLSLALEKIAKDAKLEVSDEEYEAKIKELYDYVFLVECDNIIKSFSYIDVITKVIRIDY